MLQWQECLHDDLLFLIGQKSGKISPKRVLFEIQFRKAGLFDRNRNQTWALLARKTSVCMCKWKKKKKKSGQVCFDKNSRWVVFEIHDSIIVRYLSYSLWPELRTSRTNRTFLMLCAGRFINTAAADRLANSFHIQRSPKSVTSRISSISFHRFGRRFIFYL